MMNVDWIEQHISALPWTSENRAAKQKVRSVIYDSYSLEISNPPQIAVIGKAGVGKSSTINSLFNTKLRVGRTYTGTRRPQSIRVKGERGEIIVHDLPGLADDIDRDKKTSQIYSEILSQCDVAVWVIAAEDRALAGDQYLLRDVVRYSNPDLIDRLVIGINKIDLVSPNNWNYKINLPSKAQERNFKRVISRVKKSIGKVCPEISDEKFVGYSATRFYNLIALFRTMLESCPTERAWVLGERASIGNSFSLLPNKLRVDALVLHGDRIYGSF